MTRLAQEKRILALLKAARPAEWTDPLRRAGEVPLPMILMLSPRIAQYNARIKELRAAGYDIRCRSEWVNGERHTFYRLVAEPKGSALHPLSPEKATAAASRASTAGAGTLPPSPPSPRAGATPAPASTSPAARREQPHSPRQSVSDAAERRQAVGGTAAGDSVQLELRLC